MQNLSTCSCGPVLSLAHEQTERPREGKSLALCHTAEWQPRIRSITGDSPVLLLIQPKLLIPTCQPGVTPSKSIEDPCLNGLVATKMYPSKRAISQAPVFRYPFPGPRGIPQAWEWGSESRQTQGADQPCTVGTSTSQLANGFQTSLSTMHNETLDTVIHLHIYPPTNLAFIT